MRARRTSASYLVTLVACLCALVGLSVSTAAATTTPLTTPNASRGGDPIVIARVLGRTGFLGAYDGPPADGIDIWVKEWNAKGGILGRQIKLVDYDTKTDLSLVATTAVEALNAGADILVVSCDFDFGGPAAVEAQKRGVVAISVCAGSLKFGPLGIGQLAFSMGAPAPTWGAVDAEWAVEQQDWRNAYVLLDPTIVFDKENCAGFEQRFKQLGGKIVGKDTFQQKDVSIATQITRLKAVKPQPDFIYPCSYNPGISTAIKQIRAAGIKLPIVAIGDFDGEYWKGALPRVSDLYFSTYASIYGDDPNSAVNKFFRDYRRIKGKAPVTSYPILGYSLMQALKIAVEKAKTTEGAKVAAELVKAQRMPLLMGSSTLSPRFHLILFRSMRIMQVQNGKTSFVSIERPLKVPDTSRI